MKKIRYLTLALLLLFGFGCKKEPSAKSATLSNIQAANMAAASLAINAGGVLTLKNDIAVYAHSLTGTGKGCDVPDSFNQARQDNPTTNIEYNYAFGYTYTVACVNNEADHLNVDITYNGSFDTAALSAINSGTCNFNLSSLSGSDATYTISGKYVSNGSFDTNDDNKLSGSNGVTINLNALTINKTNRNITSGTADISITGTLKNKNTFNYSGTVVFKSATSAVLTIDGVGYNLNTTTGDISLI